MENPRYIGDGVYATFNGCQVILTQDNDNG